MQSFVMLVAVASHLLIELSHKLPSQLTMGGDPLEIIAIDVDSKKVVFSRILFPESIAAVPLAQCARN